MAFSEILSQKYQIFIRLLIQESQQDDKRNVALKSKSDNSAVENG